MTRILRCLVCLLSVLMVVSCDPQSEKGSRQTDRAAAPAQIFTVTGQVVQLLPEKRQVRIKHEEIPNYMPAMTMPFDVRNTNELAGLQPGDQIVFRLTVTEQDGWIDQVKKTGVGPPNESGPRPMPPPPGANNAWRQVRDVEPLEPGQPLPDYTFTNQFGQAIHTSQFKGQALAITFVFTRCPYPTFCPRMSANFAAVQELLKTTPNAPTNWHLLSLSFDPDFDTPAVLKSYAQGYKYDPARWTFATGLLMDITAIGEQFGLRFWRDEKGSISHNLRTVVIDPAGRFRKSFDANEWSSRELADELIAAARQN